MEGTPSEKNGKKKKRDKMIEMTLKQQRRVKSSRNEIKEVTMSQNCCDAVRKNIEVETALPYHRKVLSKREQGRKQWGRGTDMNSTKSKAYMPTEKILNELNRFITP